MDVSRQPTNRGGRLKLCFVVTHLSGKGLSQSELLLRLQLESLVFIPLGPPDLERPAAHLHLVQLQHVACQLDRAHLHKREPAYTREFKRGKGRTGRAKQCCKVSLVEMGMKTQLKS